MGERHEFTKGLFADLPSLKPDVILDLARQFRADTSSKKVDLGIGAYRTEAGKPYVLPVVKEAEERLAAQADYNHEYVPIEGYAPFNSACRGLVFGTNHAAVQEDRVATVQSLSGTGALRVALEFLRRYVESPVVYIPDQTWGNHHNLVRDAGIKDARTYRYYNELAGALDFNGMAEDLEQAPMGSIIILHMCAHNPTGWDPTREQWQRLAEICQSRKHIPLFDNAYQGYATGSLEEDAYSVRHFADCGIQLLVACSFAKNMGLYGERVGALHMLCQSKDEAERVVAHLKAIIRPMYSSPPCHYAKVAALILTDPELYLKWQEELTSMARRVIQMRQMLFAALVKNECPGSWGHVTEQIGMFSFTGLTAKQVRVLKSKYHIYMLDNGRASMCGLNEGNVEYVADAIKAVVSMEDENEERRS